MKILFFYDHFYARGRINGPDILKNNRFLDTVGLVGFELLGSGANHATS